MENDQSSWNDERKWLIGSLVLAAVFLMLASTLLARLTGLQRLRLIGQLVFLGLLLMGVAYFTYNTWQHYQYHGQLKQEGHEETVQVQATSRRALSKRSSWFYTYEATVVRNYLDALLGLPWGPRRERAYQLFAAAWRSRPVNWAWDRLPMTVRYNTYAQRGFAAAR